MNYGGGAVHTVRLGADRRDAPRALDLNPASPAAGEGGEFMPAGILRRPAASWVERRGTNTASDCGFGRAGRIATARNQEPRRCASRAGTRGSPSTVPGERHRENRARSDPVRSPLRAGRRGEPRLRERPLDPGRRRNGARPRWRCSYPKRARCGGARSPSTRSRVCSICCVSRWISEEGKLDFPGQAQRPWTCCTSMTWGRRTEPIGARAALLHRQRPATSPSGRSCDANLMPDELSERLGSRTVSRLVEICGDLIPLFGEDKAARVSRARAPGLSPGLLHCPLVCPDRDSRRPVG